MSDNLSEVKHYKVKTLSSTLRPNTVYYVKATSDTQIKTYITDQGGSPFPLIDLNTGSLQPGDNISLLFNNVGYITYANLASAIGGTTNYITKFTSNNTVGDSIMYEATGKIGIGTTTPLALIHGQATAITGGRESIYAATVSDNAVDKFFIANGTTTNGRFIPTHVGYTEGGYQSLLFRGLGRSADDLSSSSPFIQYLAATTSSSTDPNNGVLTNPVSRPLFSWGSVSERMRLLANGNLGIGTTLPTEMFHVAGNFRLEDSFYDSNNFEGNNGDFLMSTVTGTEWTDVTSLIPTSTSQLTNDGEDGVNPFITLADIPPVTPAAMTKVDDTNVTLTLGGSPSTSLLQATSLTLGWTGTLADSRIASASTWNGKFTLPTLTSGSVLFSNGTTITQDNANLFWDDTNNRLGIGTNAPTTTLDVRGRITGTESLYLGTGGATSNQIVINGTGSNAGIYSPSYSSGTTNIISFKDYSGAEKMRLFSTGNLAINSTTDAGFKLDVNGTARFGTSAKVELGDFSGGGQSYGLLKVDFAGGWAFGISNLAKSQVYFEIRSTGQTIFGSGNSNFSSLSASAKVQIDSTTQGFLPPRMTTTQKNAIATPAAGLVVYDTTLGKLCVRTAAAWETITSI